MNKLCRHILCFYMLLQGFVAFAQIQVSPLLKLETWNVGIIGIKTDNYEKLSKTQQEVSVSLRPILAVVVKEVREHYLSTEEKDRAKELIKKDAISILNNQLEAKIETDDKQALENEKLDIWDKRLNSAQERRALSRRIKKINRINSKNISVPNKLAVSYVEQTEYLRISSIEDFQRIAVSLNAHSLLYYQVYPLDDYTIIEVFEYNVLTNRSRKVLRTVVDYKNINQIYKSLQTSLQSVILGTESASLNIRAETKDSNLLHDAKILLDGEVVGFGSIDFGVLPAGTHVITIIYESEQRNEVVVLNSSEKVRRTYLFDIEVEDTITVQTIPSDAKVYINSEWVGNSPIVIPKPGTVKELEVRVPGYFTHRYTINADTSSFYQIVLEPVNPILLEDRIEWDRRKFYNAFSLFAISLVVPVIFNGLYVNEANAYFIGGASLSDAGFADYQLNNNIYYFSFIGTAAVSTGLGIFTYIRLRKYLNTASEYHER